MLAVLRETEKDLSRQHLISLNVANGAKKVEHPPEGVSIFNFHYCTPPEAVKMNYGLNKLIGENETGFRGKHDFLYRSEGWDFLLAGGGTLQQPRLLVHRRTPRGRPPRLSRAREVAARNSANNLES